MSQSISRHTIDLIAAALLGFVISSSAHELWSLFRSFRHDADPDIRPASNETIVDGVTGLIGNTPLVRIKSLSHALGVDILGKAEFLNPGGSVKDRVALQMIEDAESSGLLKPYTGSRIFEGTVGSTGISIATLAAARGYLTTIIMPDDVAAEKVQALRCLGADIEQVRPASIVDKKQFVNLAKSRAEAFGNNTSFVSTGANTQGDEKETVVVTSNDGSPDETVSIPIISGSGSTGFFADQFENDSNFKAHYRETGPEIWRQCGGHLDAFVCGAGTGGTMAGTGCFLKSKKPDLRIVLADPQGSGLYNKIKHGVMFDLKESEGRRRRHQVDTVVEGIGINRLTRNFERALPIIDDAIRVTDEEAVSMSRHLVKQDGLFLGSSSACNLVAAVKVAKLLTQGTGGNKVRPRIVTILCDSGSRHYSKLWNDDYLAKAGIPIDMTITERLLSP